MELIKGLGPGPASLQAASPPEEGEAPVAEAAPPSPEDLIGVLLALFSVGDFGKKLYSVLCRDIATDGQAQPFYRSERLEAKHPPRGACWREIRGRRAAPKEDWPQPPIGRRLGVSGQCLDGARPAPPPKGAGRRGEERGGAGVLRGAAVRTATGPSARDGNCSGPGTLAWGLVGTETPREEAHLRDSESLPSLKGKEAPLGVASTRRALVCRVHAPRGHEWLRCWRRTEGPRKEAPSRGRLPAEDCFHQGTGNEKIPLSPVNVVFSKRCT